MSRPIRIGLVHALYASIAAIDAAFARSWPEAERAHLFDGSLYLEFDKSRKVTPAIHRRIATLLSLSADSGAEAILFTGSLFGAPVEEIRAGMDVPVLTSYESMLEDAFAMGERLGLLATLQDTLDMMQADIERHARQTGKRYELEARVVAGAMPALQAGDRERHDALIEAAALEMRDRDAVMLGQFSMAPALDRLPDELKPRFLTATDSAVAKLRGLLAAS